MLRGSSLDGSAHGFRVHVTPVLPKRGATWRFDEELAHLRHGGFEHFLVDESMFMLVDEILNVVERPLHEQTKGMRVFLIQFVRPVMALVPDLRISRVIEDCKTVL